MERERGMGLTTYLSGTWVEYPRGCDGSKGLPHCLAHPEPLSLTCPWKQYQWRASSSCLQTELELACADAELALLHQEFCNNKKVIILLPEYLKDLPWVSCLIQWLTVPEVFINSAGSLQQELGMLGYTLGTVSLCRWANDTMSLHQTWY